MTSLEKRLTTLDLPMLYRNSVGLDRWINNQLDALRPSTITSNYPPYNVIRLEDENKYLIEIACAGFTDKDITISINNGNLRVEGTQVTEEVKDDEGNTAEGPRYLYRGISSRSWAREFTLQDYVEVKGASMKNGMLTIELERVLPEALKPRNIPIQLK